MRVVISNPRRVWGGAATNTVILARGLKQRGHDVRVFCDPASPFRETLAGEIPVEPILSGWELSPRVIARCLRAFRTHRTEIVLCNTAKDLRLTAVAARLAGLPIVVRWGGGATFRDVATHRFYYGVLPHHMVTVGPSLPAALLESVPWLRQDRLTAIPNSVDVDEIASAQAVDLDLPAGALAVGFLGRISVEKGIADLLTAWPRVADALPAAHLLIAGGGPDEAEFRQRFSGVPRVRWLGLRRDPVSFLKALDLLVLPSYDEGLPNVLLEAMAVGTPVVATPVGAVPDLVDDGRTGRFVTPGEIDALARVIIELAGDPAARERLSGAARVHVQNNFSRPAMIAAYERLLGEVIQRNAKSN